MMKLGYLLSGLTNRWGQPRRCPACHSPASATVDRKYFHTLQECRNCYLRYRYPSETPEQMAKFYQSAYKQPGITTDLPSIPELQSFLATQFRNSGKDATRIISLFKALNVGPGDRILDFGASWGYITWQFRHAGYQVDALEISRPRAEFGNQHLNLSIKTSLAEITDSYDVVFSSHVLEHVPNPLETLRWMAEHTRPGGSVIALTPNGSAEAQTLAPVRYRHHWGLVHPVLLTAKFLRECKFFEQLACATQAEFTPEDMESWKGAADGSFEHGELAFVGRVKTPPR